MGEAALEAFEERLGHRFARRRLLERAFVHRSYANELGLDDQYERLEFLGDAVLGLAAAAWLYRGYPERPEGELSQRKAFLVSAPVLAAHARHLELGARLRLGVGEERSGGREKESLLADSMEAVFGAVFLDGGLEAARRTIEPMLERAEAHHPRIRHGHAKTRLQELLQGRGEVLPEYRHVEAHGPEHEKRFHVECRLGDRLLGEGAGRSKKTAEMRAAKAALKVLEGASPRPSGDRGS